MPSLVRTPSPPRKPVFFYPPDPGSKKISTLGGNVAEDSGGLRGLSLKISGLGSSFATKEGIKIGFDYFKATASRASASLKPGEHDFHLHFLELHNSVPANALTLASFVALCSALLQRPVQPQFVIRGSMSLGGSIIPVEWNGGERAKRTKTAPALRGNPPHPLANGPWKTARGGTRTHTPCGTRS